MIKLLYISLIVLISSCSIDNNSYDLGENNFNYDWMFVKDVEDDSFNGEANSLNVDEWQNISLPHTAQIEDLVIEGKQWQGTSFYKKDFIVASSFADKHIGLKFEGAMHFAKVYLNGKLLKTNIGGYLPFYIDLSDEVLFDKNNTLIVELNNEDNADIPPGKPIDDLDFNYFSGIYRNVNLLIKDKLHISDESEVDRIAAGGIFVTVANSNEEEAEINVKVDVENQFDTDQNFDIEIKLKSGEEIIAIEKIKDFNVKENSYSINELGLKISNPILWDVDNPFLYNLEVNIFKNNVVVDSRIEKIGIRNIKFDAKTGFYLNGKSLKLRGTNRHQEYPYIGYALSDNANYRDAFKIKSAGFNFVRLSHYPQSESFLSACDELGILVMDAIPGWQFFGGEKFQENSLSDVRKMLRRSRNRPSVILWEASLNESEMTKEFMQRAHDAVHEEFPGDQTYTCGWLEEVYDVFIPARQHAKPPFYWNKYEGAKPILIAEYGDWEYYAQNAGFNQGAYEDLSPVERTSRQLRKDGQKRLLQQALNYQESHNSNLHGAASGDANWLMFDYNRGYSPDIESSGIMDVFRLPKFAYYFYKSQVEYSANKHFSEANIFIANYYNDPRNNEIKVYSNCEEVELYINGEKYKRQSPDSDNNSSHLLNPPFTFKLNSFIPGKLVAKGFVNGKELVSTEVNTPKKEYALKMWIDESGKKLESASNDVVFLYAAVVDEYGTIVPDADNLIEFDVIGDGEIIGSQQNAEAGISTCLLLAGKKSGSLSLKASSDGLLEARLEAKVVEKD